MPATVAAQQMFTAAIAKEMDEDFSTMFKFMEQFAGFSALPEELRKGPAQASHDK
jgi:hypothetical protein